VGKVGGERLQQTFAQQLVQHRIGVGEQPLNGTREARELRDTSRGHEADDVQPYVREERLLVWSSRGWIRAAYGAPPIAQSGARREECRLEKAVGHRRLAVDAEAALPVFARDGTIRWIDRVAAHM
jgi:hypothetical protein